MKVSVEPSNAYVTWSSTNPLVASVNQSGLVKAISQGAVTIIAQTDGDFDVCTIKVNEDISIEEHGSGDETGGKASADTDNNEETPDGGATNGVADKAADADADDTKSAGGLPMWAGALIGFFGAAVLISAVLSALGVFKK